MCNKSFKWTNTAGVVLALKCVGLVALMLLPVWITIASYIFGHMIFGLR